MKASTITAAFVLWLLPGDKKQMGARGASAIRGMEFALRHPAYARGLIAALRTETRPMTDEFARAFDDFVVEFPLLEAQPC